MIQSKKDLKDYLEADRIALGRTGKSPSPIDFVWQFETSLRKLEYYTNCKKGLFWKCIRNYYAFKFFGLSVICGFSIPKNKIGKGLSIAHRGPIIINGGTTIGDNCRIHVCVNIGTAPGCDNAAPTIGDNVYIAPGVKMYGKIEIASGIIIGANAVVTKSFTESNICIAGVPAKKISDLGRFDIEARNHKSFSNNN